MKTKMTAHEGLKADNHTACTEIHEIIGQIDPWDVVYIAGPMTGIPDYNRPAFNAMARAIAETQAEILNPARHPDGLVYSEYMRMGLADLTRATVIVILPGWQGSRGACLEIGNAAAMDIRRVYFQPNLEV